MVEPRSEYLSCIVLRDVVLYDDRSFMLVERSLHIQDEIEKRIHTGLTKCCGFITENSNMKHEVYVVGYY
jgi:hypothetical protein